MRRAIVVALLGLAAVAPTSASAGTPFCSRPIARATWTDEAQGARIKVFPSGCGRRSAFLAPQSAFRDALAAGGREANNRRSLYLQFRCHTLFAPTKRSWNLETWRPVVSSRQMIEALCNPSVRMRGTSPDSHGLFGVMLAALLRA